MTQNKNTPTIMVVEDENLLLQAISKKLQTHQIEAITATTIAQATEYLKTLPNLPNAIWLDYYLKDGNGLDFMQVLKKNPKWSQIPVIVVSNSASDEKVKNMLALGAKGYLLKAEHRLEDIINTIIKFIKEEK